MPVIVKVSDYARAPYPVLEQFEVEQIVALRTIGMGDAEGIK